MRKGLSIIELVIAVAIIALMAGVGIPAFSRHSNFVEWKEKVGNIKDSLERLNIQAKNPQKGYVAYMLKLNDSETEWNYYAVKVDKTAEPIGSIKLESVETVTMSNLNVVAPPGMAGDESFVYEAVMCDSTFSGKCCFGVIEKTVGADTQYYCHASNAFTTETEFMTLETTRVNKSAVFKGTSLPLFNIKVEENAI